MEVHNADLAFLQNSEAFRLVRCAAKITAEELGLRLYQIYTRKERDELSMLYVEKVTAAMDEAAQPRF